MPQCITYTVGDGLYVNMTNRCTCACDFCERNTTDTVGDADSLWLDTEPTRDEIWQSIAARDLSRYRELVFCGFGEPMLRLDDLLWVAKRVKETAPSLPVRINTNGHANLIAGRDVTPDLAGCVDSLSISLNRPDAALYTAHMRPVFGAAAFDSLLDFTAKARRYVPAVTLSVVDLLPPDELARCRALADSLGVPLRVRAYHP